MDNIFIAQLLGTPPRQSRIVEKMDGLVRRIFPWIRIDSAWRSGERMGNIELRTHLFHFLTQIITFQVPGDIVEIGCHAGESSVVLQKIIKEMDDSRQLHVYDSFQGIPQPSSIDKDVYELGDMSASEDKFRENFSRVGLQLPIIHAGWFEETLIESQLPEKIAFGWIDCDIYEASLLALEKIYPLLSSNAVVFFGAFSDPKRDAAITTKKVYKSPGIQRATDEFLSNKPEEVSILLTGTHTSGYFRKK